MQGKIGSTQDKAELPCVDFMLEWSYVARNHRRAIRVYLDSVVWNHPPDAAPGRLRRAVDGPFSAALRGLIDDDCMEKHSYGMTVLFCRT
jgi:hypothetical protein